MGGSAGSNNAQIFDLMARYGNGNKPQSSMFASKDAIKAELKRQMDAGHGVLGMMYGLDTMNNRNNSANRGMGGGGGGGGGNNKPKPPVTDPTSFSWQFPQYTQTWAFTPPTPSPYINPPPFNTKKFGDPLGKKNT